MKRKFFLLLSILGLIVTEYGCDDRRSGGGVTRTPLITGIENTLLLIVDSLRRELGEAKDTAVFDRFMVQTTFSHEYVKENFSANYSAYAAPLPAPSVSLELDSIKIRNMATSDSVDITSSFVLTVKYDNYQDIELTNDSVFRRETKFANSYPLIYELFMNEPPSETSEHIFQIKYYAWNGDIFETNTDPIIITPQ